MAKSTHSQEILTGTSDSYTETELEAGERPFPRYNRPELGTVDQPVTTEEEETDALDRVTEETDSDDDSEDDEWDGGSSIPSSESANKPEPSSKHSNPKPARTTDNRSNQTGQGDYTADSTDGVTQKEEPKQSSRARKVTPATVKARTRTTEEDDFGFKV